MNSKTVLQKSCRGAQRRQQLCGSHYNKKLGEPLTQITYTPCAVPRCVCGSMEWLRKPTRRPFGDLHHQPPLPPRPGCWLLLWHWPASWGLWPNPLSHLQLCSGSCLQGSAQRFGLSLKVFIFVLSFFSSGSACFAGVRPPEADPQDRMGGAKGHTRDTFSLQTLLLKGDRAFHCAAPKS